MRVTIELHDIDIERIKKRKRYYTDGTAENSMLDGDWLKEVSLLDAQIASFFCSELKAQGVLDERK